MKDNQFSPGQQVISVHFEREHFLMVNNLRVHFEREKNKQMKLSANGTDNKYTIIQCKWEC